MQTPQEQSTGHPTSRPFIAMWWKRAQLKDRELEALREEVARLRRANGELERRMEELQASSDQQAEVLDLSASARCVGASRGRAASPGRTPRMRQGNAERDFGEEQAKLLEAYDKVSMIGEAMRMTKASEVAAWKEKDFMPLAYRLRDAPIPRVNYEALMAAMKSSSTPCRLSIETGEDSGLRVPDPKEVLPVHMNQAAFQFFGVSSLQAQIAAEYRARKYW